MRLPTILLLTILNLTAQAQTIMSRIDYSPDKNFQLLIIVDGPDSFPEWNYWLITDNKDTTLLTTTTTHHEFPPAAFWSNSSDKIIFEDQTHENNDNQIKIYNLKDKKIEFATKGFIWGHGDNNFDQNRGLLFYFLRIENNNRTFDLMALNIETKEIRKLSSVITSGDPLTGAPEIGSLDMTKKRMTLTFERADSKSKKRKVDY